eukprot:3499865-Pleurochrysis_carterae.AAC.3
MPAIDVLRASMVLRVVREVDGGHVVHTKGSSSAGCCVRSGWLASGRFSSSGAWAPWITGARAARFGSVRGHERSLVCLGFNATLDVACLHI